MDDVLPGGQIIVACAAVSLTIGTSLCVASTVLLRAALLLCGGTVIGGVSASALIRLCSAVGIGAGYTATLCASAGVLSRPSAAFSTRICCAAVSA